MADTFTPPADVARNARQALDGVVPRLCAHDRGPHSVSHSDVLVFLAANV